MRSKYWDGDMTAGRSIIEPRRKYDRLVLSFKVYRICIDKELSSNVLSE